MLAAPIPDAVVYNLERRTTGCKAKALTTKWDFTIGIENALAKLDPDEIRGYRGPDDPKSGGKRLIIPRFKHLLADLEQVLDRFDIQAPIVVVKGDGTLMDAAMAKRRPVETILSGPAASVAGARHLTGRVPMRPWTIYDTT